MLVDSFGDGFKIGDGENRGLFVYIVFVSRELGEIPWEAFGEIGTLAG